MQKPSISIHYGASNDDITVDGNTFVRHKLCTKDRAFVRNVVIDALVKCGAVQRSPARRRGGRK